MYWTEGILYLIYFAGLAYLIFFKEYFKVKGFNLAQKEDIAKITREIEGVKQEFNTKNTLLNAQLQHIISNQIQHSNEERNSIIKFYDTYSKWVNSGLLDIEVFKYHRNNIEELTEKKRSLDVMYYETRMMQDRIDLLVEDREVYKASLMLVTETLKTNHALLPLLLELEQNLHEDKMNMDLFLTVINVKPLPPDAERLAKEEQEIKARRGKITARILEIKGAEYQRLLPIIAAFTDRAKNYFVKTKNL